MKSLFAFFLLTASLFSYGQRYPFGKHFTAGTIMLKDSTVKTGYIKYPLNRSEKIRFRENIGSASKRYSAKQLLGFKVDSFNFVSLSNFKAIANNYPVFASRSKVKNVFGEQIEQGKINTFLVYVHCYDATSKSWDTYPNVVFEKMDKGQQQFATYPYKVRMGTGNMKGQRMNCMPSSTDILWC